VYWHDFAAKNLFGIEINEQIARTAKMNMIIHDDGHTNVISSDGLLNSDAIIKKSGNKEFKYDSFDFIITNPPFGSTIKQTERAYLHQYNLGNKDTSWLDANNAGVKGRANQSTEVLFIEQCYNFLKPGGYLAIVVPDGILTNSSLQYVRDQIEEWYRIVAVVSMPQDAFAHTGAAVKSSVMFLRKWDNKRSEEISNLKKSIQEKLKKDKNYIKLIETLEKQKKDAIKKYKTDNKLDDKDEKFIEKKKKITDEYNQKINDLKEELSDLYIEEKQKKLDDYQIFMAIAEKIGYDATGKTISENELDEMISPELKGFIEILEAERI
jgi:type I restriction enzyme M protein